MTNKLSDKDKKDWQNFLDSSEKLQSKDLDKINDKIILERSIDLHGYTLEEANRKICEFIENCYVSKVKKVNVITGKGMRSKNMEDPYQSKDLSILKYYAGKKFKPISIYQNNQLFNFSFYFSIFN